MLTLDESLDLLRRAVQEKGQWYVDPNAESDGCQYVNGDGQAGCIVGHVFAYLDWLRYIDDYNNTDTVDQLADQADFPAIDEDALLVLRWAQSKQDQGGTWGEALAVAEDKAKTVREGGSIALT